LPPISTLSVLERLRIVLVGTQHPGNIGAAARAMKTMGLRRLLLVTPERFPHRDAVAMAAGASDVLETATLAASVAEAVAGCHWVVGCTARSRRIALDTLLPRAAATQTLAAAVAGREIALVFGRERTGLENAELQLCHAAVEIPADPDYGSLNLAAAVQVVSYELRLAALAGAPAIDTDGERPAEPATHAQLEGLFTHLGQTLEAIDFHKGRAPDSALHKLRRIFLRSDLSAREVRLLHGVLADTDRMARIAQARE